MLATAGAENRQERREQWPRQHEGEAPGEEGQGLCLPLPYWDLTTSAPTSGPSSLSIRGGSWA